MTQDEIIEMARQIATQASKVGPYRTWTHEYAMSLIMQLVYASAANEREAYWNILFEYAGRDDLTPEDESLLTHLADLIRARGEA